MKAVINKPGYKHTRLGWIPEDWEVKKLNDIARINPPKKAQSDPTLVSFLAMADISENGEILNEQEVEYGQVKNGFTAFEKNDVIVAKITPCFENGKGAFLNKLKHEVGFGSTEFHVIRANERVIPQVIFYHTRLNSFKGIGELNMVGSAGQKRVPSSFIEGYSIPLPPLPEQYRIATILSTWDAAIAKEQQLIDALQTRHRALMQQLLSGKKRLKGFKGEWKKVSYGNLLKEVKRPVIWSDDELYQLISVRRRSGGIFSREALYGYQIKVKDLRTANAGDFLFSKMQIVHGASALVTQDFHGAKISGSYIAVVAKDPQKIDMDFFNWYSQQLYFYHQTYISSFGVHIEKMTFDFDAFLSLEITLPPLSEQTAIANILSTSEKGIQTRRRRLAALQQQKKGLMQVLLTGKVRVKTNVKEKL